MLMSLQKAFTTAAGLGMPLMHPSIIMSAVYYQRAVALDEVTNKEAKLEVNLATSQPHEAAGAIKLLHYPAQHVLQTFSSHSIY